MFQVLPFQATPVETAVFEAFEAEKRVAQNVRRFWTALHLVAALRMTQKVSRVFGS